MNIATAFPSKFLKAADLEIDTTYTIKKIATETVGQGADAEEKPVVYFKEVEQGLALNKTNANTIASLYGNETDSWVGKQITLFQTEVEFAGKQTLAVRVRMKKPNGGNSLPPTTTTPPADPFTGAPDPLGDAKLQAWNAFLAKWVPHEEKNPADANARNTRFQMAQLEYAKTMQKTLPDFTIADYKGLTVEIAKNFDVATGTFLPF